MSVKIYPVTPTADVCTDYTVLINGQAVPVHTARVSAVPFNRRWPGHQRELEQTELINFVLLESDEMVSFEITAPASFAGVEVRPRTLGIIPETRGKTIRFSVEGNAYLTVEPYGRRRALHIFIDPVCDYGVDPRDPNVLYFGPGEHDVGQIDLKSGQTLFIDEGAVVYSCVTARGADHIRILGRGILDNSRNKEKILYECNAVDNFAAVENARRQHCMQLDYCTNTVIDGITIRDSLVYNIRPVCCDDLLIQNVKIIGCWRYNSDGIDSHNCRRLTIRNCFLRTFDDSICVKGMDCWQKPEDMYYNGVCHNTAEDVLVENCTIWNDWANSLEIGAETRADEIKNLTYRNCNIIHVNGPAMGCYNVDRAEVHNVLYENITVEYDDVMEKGVIQKADGEQYVNPDPDYAPRLIYVNTDYHAEYSEDAHRRGKNHHFTYKNIRVYGRHKLWIHMEGYDEEHLTHDMLIDGLYHNDQPITDFKELKVKLEPFTANIELK